MVAMRLLTRSGPAWVSSFNPGTDELGAHLNDSNEDQVVIVFQGVVD